jgi:putative ABC transport system permease protein
MRDWIKEIHVAARGLAANPTFTLVSVITLALGIGATSALFSAVDAVLLEPLLYREPDRLVRVFGTRSHRHDDQASFSLPDYFDLMRESRALENLTGFVRWSYNLAGDETGQPQRVWGGIVTADLFRTMRVKPLLGRTFLAEEDRPGGNRVVVLSHELWRSLFAGAPDAIGKKLRLDDLEYAIVGIMPPGFEFPSDARLWTPLGMAPDTFPRSVHFLRMVGRLAPRVTLEQAQGEMSTLARRLELQYPDSNTGRGVRLVPLQEHLVGDVRPALLVLLGATACVLLIACANVANLLLARFNQRCSEAALRRALGASRGRLFRPAFLEAVLLATMGGVLGVTLAYGAVKVLVALNLARQNPSFLADRLHDVPRLDQVGIDGRVLAFTALVSLAAAVVVSLFPALQLSERSLTRVLDNGSKGTLGGGGGRRLRQMLVVAEVAVALTLVIGAGLLIRSFERLARLDPGFRSEGVMTFQVSLPLMKYLKGQQAADFNQELIERIEALPGVISAGAAWGLPLSGLTATSGFEIEGRPAAAGQSDEAAIQPVSPRYFETLGIPLVRGRFFTGRDDRDAPPVVLINEAMARRFWPGEDPLGKRLTVEGTFGPVGSLPKVAREIVGVVADFKGAGLARETAAEMYFPFSQVTWRMMSVVVRTRGNPAGLANTLRRQVWAIDKDLAVFQLRPMDEIVSQSMAQSRSNMVLLTLFAVISLVLAVIGVYGSISYSVSLRSQEIGIRMALGARQGDVLRQVLREGTALTLFGLVAGTLGALALTRLLSALLFGIEPTDPVTFVGVPLLFLLVALLATYLPARRATRVDPLIAFRR